MFRLMFRLLKLKLVQQELRDRWDAGDRVGLVVRPAKYPRRTRVGKLSIRNLYDLEDSNEVKIIQEILAARRLREAVTSSISGTIQQ